jgi:hypothetical protein
MAEDACTQNEDDIGEVYTGTCCWMFVCVCGKSDHQMVWTLSEKPILGIFPHFFFEDVSHLHGRGK